MNYELIESRVLQMCEGNIAQSHKQMITYIKYAICELTSVRDLNDCYLIYDITLDDLAESVLTYILNNDYLKRKEQD